MKTRSLFFRRARHASVAALLCVGLGASVSCDSFDNTRRAPPKATLGDDVYGLLCDRLGTSVLAEDLTGASYYGVCHYDAKGNYQDSVDASALPPAKGDAEINSRTLAIAKLTTLASRRADVIRAVNATFPADTTLDDGKGGTIKLHAALMDFAQRVSDLYDTNPYDPSGEPLIPSSTRALGRFFDAFTKSGDARGALARIWGRKGYRPSSVGLGAIRAALAYPKLRDLATKSIAVVGPGAPSAPALQKLLEVTKHELATSSAVVEPLPIYSVDAATLQPNRPRSTLEMMGAMMLSEDPSFAQNDADPPRYIALRDRRGFAIPLGNTPGSIGTVMAPFADVNGDGFADVDASGRFVDASGAPLGLATPFVIPGVSDEQGDGFGRIVNSPYSYLDTSRSLTGAIARHLVALVDPTIDAPGDPNAYQQEHETLMYAIAGATALSGARVPAQYDYVNDVVKGMGEACDGCVQYSRFQAETSPLVELVHAAGQVLGDKDSDAILASLIDLVDNHEDVMARLIGAMLKVREVSLQHDQAAAQGTEPIASLDYQDPIWDQVAQLLNQIVKRPGLTQRLVESLAEPDLVTPHGTSMHMGETTAVFSTTRDKLTYDPNNINGPAINLTVGGASTSDPITPIDPNAPRTGDNISIMQRALLVIHDANRASACNKQGAVVHTSFGIDWPIWPASPYNECELTRFDNEAIYYLDSNLPIDHPKRSQMTVPGALGSILALGSDIGIDPSSVLEQSSGLTGFTLHPESFALTRLLFFGAESNAFPNMPDLDAVNYGGQTDEFIHDLLEPVGGLPCPQDAAKVNTCSTPNDTLRVRDADSMFAWERLGFLDYLKPTIRAFADESCTADESACDQSDLSGEQILVDLFDQLNFHWPGKDHGDECTSDGTETSNPKYCYGSGLNRYEPIFGDAFRTDLIPALNAFAIAARDLSKITVQRGPHAGETWTGTQVLERLTDILFDQDYAKSAGMVDENGNASAHWVDGTPQAQLTPFTLFADALHDIDVSFSTATDGAERQGMWKRARSQLVDEFASVDGEGTTAAFHDRGFAKLLSTILKVTREQINANCPDRETNNQCPWARHDLAQKLETTMSGPLYASMMDLMESLRGNEDARRALESFLTYGLQAASNGDALQGMLASASDLLQVLADDDNMAPLFDAVSNVANPDGDPDGDGAVTTIVRVLKALTGDDYDRYHLLDVVLPNLVTPMDDGTGLSPIEIFLDVIGDVNRVDASVQDPLAEGDYDAIMTTMRDFMTDPTRGLEQIYTIVKNRPR